MLEVNTTWQTFLDEVCQRAEAEHQGYHIYERYDGFHDYMSDEVFKLQEGLLPGRAIAYVYAEPVIHDGKVVARYEFVGNLVAIYPDKKIRQRGAQVGNDNAKKGKYPRRVLSHAGTAFDLVIDHLKTQGCDDPSNSEVLEAMDSAFRQVYG